MPPRPRWRARPLGLLSHLACPLRPVVPRSCALLRGAERFPKTLHTRSDTSSSPLTKNKNVEDLSLSDPAKAAWEHASATRSRADAARGQAQQLRDMAVDARADKLDERADKLVAEAKELDERADKLVAEAKELDERADKLVAEAKEVLELGSTRLETTDGDRKFLESLMGPRWKVLGGGVADLVDEHGRLTLTLDSLLQRAWETRAALVADKPSNLNHNMVLELVMASPHVLLTDEDEAVPLFVREEQLYVAGLIEEHRRSEKGKVVICIGSPGIGKSFSLLFLLHMYLRAGMTVVFESVELKCMWVFSGEHKEVRRLEEPRFGANDLKKLIPELYDPSTIYLFDPARTASTTAAQVLPVPAFRVVAASPNPAHYSQTVKGPGVEMICVTALTAEVAVVQGGALGVEESVVLHRYEKVGGVARHLFDKRRFEAAVSRQNEVLLGASLKHFGAGMLAPDHSLDTGSSASSKLFHMVPSDDRREFTIEPLTPSLGRRIVTHLTGRDLTELWKIVNDPTDRMTKCRPYALEIIAKDHFKLGTREIEVQPMGTDGLGSATTLECPITAVDDATYDPLCLGGLLDDEVAYWPRKATFPGVDGFVLRRGRTSVVGFQVTLARDGHPLPLSAIKAIRDQVGAGVAIHVVFCVPTDVSDVYEKAQALPLPKSLTPSKTRSSKNTLTPVQEEEKAELESHATNVFQYRYVLHEGATT
jgi:hypothetical protein